MTSRIGRHRKRVETKCFRIASYRKRRVGLGQMKSKSDIIERRRRRGWTFGTHVLSRSLQRGLERLQKVSRAGEWLGRLTHCRQLNECADAVEGSCRVQNNIPNLGHVGAHCPASPLRAFLPQTLSATLTTKLQVIMLLILSYTLLKRQAPCLPSQ